MYLYFESSKIKSVYENKIDGVALIPGISRNDNLYTKSEMERADGVTGILDWEHDRNQVIGTVEFSYDDIMQVLNYEATITDQHYANLVKENPDKYKVSIEAEAGDITSICNNPNDCFNMPKDLKFVGMAITENPGVVSTTLNVRESRYKNNLYILPKRADNMPKIVETNKSKDDKIAELQEQLDKLKENEQPDAGVDQEKPDIEPPMDTKRVDYDNVPADNTEMKHDDDHKEMDDDDDHKEMGDHKDMDKECDKQHESTVVGSPQYASASKLAEVESKLKQLESATSDEMFKKKFNEQAYTKSLINPKGPRNVLESQVNDIWHRVLTNGRHITQIDMGETSWLNETYARGKSLRLDEAVGFTGDQSNKTNIVNRIMIRPGGNYAKSIRDLVRYVEIPDGTDEIKLTYMDVPSIQSFTEGTATAAATHTATTVALSADAVTGNAQTIGASQIEDTPQDLLSAIAETARIGALNAEANSVFNTTAQGISSTDLGRWINGNTGATISGTTDNAVGATATFTHNALAAAHQYYSSQGYDVSPGTIKCALHPKQFNDLITDDDIQRYTRDIDADAISKGKIPQLYGIDLIPMNRIPQQNNSTGQDPYRAICFIPDYSFVLGSKRQLTIDIQKRPRSSSYDWAWTHRIGSRTYDPASIVRISSV